MMGHLQQFFQYLLHIDTYLLSFVSHYGAWTYLALFLIIFCETGLVFTPFLPGDSLLFTAGSLAAHPDQPLAMPMLCVLLIISSILGNQINYAIGKFLGPRVFTNRLPLLNKKYLLETQAFYEKHGGKTIIIARFLPIIRTFAPFVAGIGAMRFIRFTIYNGFSALLWISSLLLAGYFFGGLPLVKNHFSVVIYGIIAITLLPPFIGIFYRKNRLPLRQSSH